MNVACLGTRRLLVVQRSLLYVWASLWLQSSRHMCLSFSGFGIAEAGKRRMRRSRSVYKSEEVLFLHCYVVAKVFWVVVSMLLGGCSQDPIKFEILFKWVLDKLYNKVNSTVQILLMSDLANTMNKRNTCALFDTFLATLRDKRNQSSGAKSTEWRLYNWVQNTVSEEQAGEVSSERLTAG